MRLFQNHVAARDAWLALGVAALSGAIAAAGAAIGHMRQVGEICGGATPHCAACYIAPALLLLALTAFVKSRRTTAAVKIGHDRGTESLRLARHGGRSAL